MEIKQADKHEEIRVEITINKQHFTWDSWTITGQQVLDQVHESSEEYKVFIKRTGHDDDPVGLDQEVDLHVAEDRHFRTVPKETTEG